MFVDTSISLEAPQIEKNGNVDLYIQSCTMGDFVINAVKYIMILLIQ